MGLPLLREDALSTADQGLVLRLCLPWIRSLPLSSVRDLKVGVDGRLVDGVGVLLGDRLVAAAELETEDGWWFVQDRLALHLPASASTLLRVAVSFQLAVPYLAAGPAGPLTLPFHAERDLVVDSAASAPTVARDVA